MSALPEQSLILIHKYLKDELSESELIKFNLAMKDEAFRKELEFQSVVMEGIVESRRESLRNFLNEARLELDEKKRKDKDIDSNQSKVLNSKKAIFVATLLILALAGYFYINKFKSKTINHDKVFAEFYHPYFNENTERNTSTIAMDSIYDLAIESYKVEKDYGTALDRFDLVMPQSNKIKLYKANCLIELNRLSEAKRILEGINEQKDSKLQQQVEWYTMMIFVKTKNISPALESANSILTNENHLYFQDARRLIEELQK